MGVVYKLKPEVIEYIVEQKRLNKSLSCRGLTSAVRDKFQVDVSKSSINSVIKQASLSSPIGRRPKPGKPAKVFRIPPERKAHLFSDPELSKTLGHDVMITEELKEPQPPRKIVSEAEDPSAQIEINHLTIPPGPPEQKDITIEPQVVENSPSNVEKEKASDQVHWTPHPDFFSDEVKPDKVIQEKGEPIDGAGSFILKAAQWMVSKTSVLGDLLRQSPVNYPPEEVDLFSETLLFMKTFGLSDGKIDSYNQNGLWLLNGASQPVPFARFNEFISHVAQIKVMGRTFQQKCQELFSQVNYFKLQFSDQSICLIDAQLRSLWESGQTPSMFHLPIAKALDHLSTQLISNIHPLVIQYVEASKGLPGTLFDMIGACDQKEQKSIKEISVFDHHNELVASFSIIPFKKRSLIAGIMASSIEVAPQMERGALQRRRFFCQSVSKNIEYSDLGNCVFGDNQGRSISLRCLLIGEENGKFPCSGIVTNMSESQIDAIGVVSTYLRHWPNLTEGVEYLKSKTGKNSDQPAPMVSLGHIPRLEGKESYEFGDSPVDLQICADFFLSCLNIYCQKHFLSTQEGGLDFKVMKEKFYSLPGYLQTNDSELLVNIVVTEDYAWKNELNFMIKRINESRVISPSNKRLSLRVISEKL